MKTETFRVNYYVGAVLAQGGNMWLEGSKIVFSPTSALDRAMGALDVEIPFQQILGLEFKGDLLRTFNIKTADKTHKFEGSNARKVWEILDHTMKTGAAPTPVAAPSASAPSAPALPKPASSAFACNHCSHPLEPGYSFCPKCGTRIKTICSSCRKAILASWAVCAFCGWKFPPSASVGPNK